MNVSWIQSKKMLQMMKECKGENILILRIIRILFFDDNDNNNTLLVLKYKVKKSLCSIEKIKNR